MTRNLRLVEFHGRAWEVLGAEECETMLAMLDGVAMMIIAVPQPEITSPATIEATSLLSTARPSAPLPRP